MSDVKVLWEGKLNDTLQLDITDFGKGPAIYLSKLSGGKPIKKIALSREDILEKFNKVSLSAVEAYESFTGEEAPKEWEKNQEDILDREKLESQLAAATEIVELRTNGVATNILNRK